MPYTTKWEDNIFHATFSGKINALEINGFHESFHADEKFDTCRYAILDFSQVGELNLPIDEIVEISGMDYSSSITNKRLTVLFVIDDEEIETIALYYKHKISSLPWEIHVLKKLSEAQEKCL